MNTILYQRHGYRRQRRHGDPADSRLSAVLESGNGSPASLAVLYLELCGRLGLELQPVALEGGRCVAASHGGRVRTARPCSPSRGMPLHLAPQHRDGFVQQGP